MLLANYLLKSIYSLFSNCCGAADDMWARLLVVGITLVTDKYDTLSFSLTGDCIIGSAFGIGSWCLFSVFMRDLKTLIYYTSGPADSII